MVLTPPTGVWPNVLTIAGSDPSGGAGIQADLKTFAAHHTYGCAVLTALTAQNTCGVDGVMAVPADFISQQLRSLTADVRLAAIKTGMLGDAAAVSAVAQQLRPLLAGQPQLHVVVDPVMVATSGDRLLDPDAEYTLRHDLIPLATVLTPNLPEASALLGRSVTTDPADMTNAAAELLSWGPHMVVLKGGHGNDEVITDLVYSPSGPQYLTHPRLTSRHTHGTGCSLAAAITARLAYQPDDAPLAAQRAQAWLHQAIATAEQYLDVGDALGHGPVHHGWMHSVGAGRASAAG